MLGIEVIAAVLFCVLLSGLVFLLARSSLPQTDIIAPKDDVKQKNKISKKGHKHKTAKMETEKSKNIVKLDEEIETAVSQQNITKEKKVKTEVKLRAVASLVDRANCDEKEDWKKVNKLPKKVSKKENKEVKDEVLKEDANESEAVVAEVVQIQSIVDESPEKSVKSKKYNKRDKARTTSHKSESMNNETDKQPEVKINQSIVIDDIKQQNANEEMDLRRRIGELMSELDKQKSLNKEENKTNVNMVNQQNKELDILKQKMKISQSSEEKLIEELKKKNASFSDFKQQYSIVQSELTKNIVQVQSTNRDKEKLENRLKVLEESNKQLSESSQLFDEANGERENLKQRLTLVEAELKTTKVRYNELIEAKEVESNEKIAQLQSDKQKMQEHLVRVQTDLIDHNSKLQNLQQELLSTKNTHTDLLNENMRLQKVCTTLENASAQGKQQQLSDVTTRDRENCEKISELSRDIVELKELNEKLLGEKAALERQCQNVSADHIGADALNENISTLTKELDSIKLLLSQKDADSAREKQISDKLLSELNELKNEQDGLQKLVEKYKTGLESTESILSKLQSSVNEEEAKWRESLLKAESEAEKCTKELERTYTDLMRIKTVRSDKNELNFAYHCVDKSLSSLIDEMEARMNHFESSLEAVIHERDKALAQIHVQMNGTAASDNDKVLSDKMVICGEHNHECEITKIKEDLASQIELNKSLEMNCNKYQSLVSIGNDALEAEKVQVVSLKDELMRLQSTLPADSNQCSDN